jgi:hypothetical protein
MLASLASMHPESDSCLSVKAHPSQPVRNLL